MFQILSSNARRGAIRKAKHHLRMGPCPNTRIRVRMCTWVSVRVRACPYTCVHVCKRACVFVRVCVRTRARIRVRTPECVSVRSHACLHASNHVRTLANGSIDACASICACAHQYAPVHVRRLVVMCLHVHMGLSLPRSKRIRIFALLEASNLQLRQYVHQRMREKTKKRYDRKPILARGIKTDK